jgi:hypothetical protein
MYPGYSYRGGYGYYGRGYGVAYNTGSETQVTHYKQGTLIIDILDPVTDQLIWRGSADGRLPKSSDRDKSDKLAQKYVMLTMKLSIDCVSDTFIHDGV